MASRDGSEERADHQGHSFSGQVAQDHARLHVGHVYTYTNSYQTQSGLFFNSLFGGKKPNTELIDAAKHGYVQRLQTLLKDGADVDFRDKQHMIALHHAALNNRLECVRLLLEAGSVVNAQDACMQTPLYLAAFKRNEQVVHILLATPGITVVGKQGPAGSPLHAAVFAADLAIVTAILQYGATVGPFQRYELHVPLKYELHAPIEPTAVNTPDPSAVPSLDQLGSRTVWVGSKCSPLGLAGLLGRTEIMQALWVFRNPSGNEITRDLLDGSKSLAEVLAELNREEMLAWILDKQIKTHPTELDALLIVAVRSGSVGSVRLLLERGASANTTDSNGTPVLRRAVEARTQMRRNVVNMLVKRGADIKRRDKNDDSTILHVALSGGDPDLIRDLVLIHGCSIDAEDRFGRTPLCKAVQNNDYDMVLVLLDSGADASLVSSHIPRSFPIQDFTADQDLDLGATLRTWARCASLRTWVLAQKVMQEKRSRSR